MRFLVMTIPEFIRWCKNMRGGNVFEGTLNEYMSKTYPNYEGWHCTTRRGLNNIFILKDNKWQEFSIETGSFVIGGGYSLLDTPLKIRKQLEVELRISK